MKPALTYKYLPPALAEALRDANLFVRRPVQGGKQGLHRSPQFGSSVEFAEYRDYVPGDPPSRIDWPVFARTDRFMVRRFQEETNLRAYVLLDVSGSLAFQDVGPVSKLEYGAYLAAGLMYILISQGDSVALITFDRKVRQVFPLTGTFEGLRPMLLYLEELEARAPGDIEAAFHEAAAMILPRSLVIIISDLLQTGQEIARGLRHFYHDGHNLLVLHVTDGGEMELSFDGLVELQDMETGERMVIEVDAIREKYRKAVEQHVEKIRSVCAECCADYRLIDTRSSVERELHQLQTGAHVRAV
ncbi:MAG: DUF58 domain-containing protein [Kiritimatiellae bacterium]|nr:DUF58 domain-containing protein [Kiritimatiellia bacterium]